MKVSFPAITWDSRSQKGAIMNNSIFEQDAIKNVQKYLRQLSFHNDDIRTVPIDGIWEEQTRASLTDFQKKHGLPVTGTVDRATFDLLKEEYNKSVALNSPPVPLSIFPRVPKGYVAEIGNSGYITDSIQYLLQELERLYNFSDYTPSGIYDEATASVVRDFQKRNHILVTGKVDRETWDALAVQHNLLLEYGE